MPRIGIFGDSIAWGSWDPVAGGWATRLRLHLMRQAGPPETEPDEYASVHAMAVGGHQVADVLRRLPADLAMLQASTVIVAIGTNDCSEESPATDLADFARDYASVLDLAARNARVIALTPPPVDAGVRPNQHAALPAYRGRISRLCGEREVLLIDEYGDFTDEDLCADGLHPNSSGHEKIFRTVLAALSRQH